MSLLEYNESNREEIHRSRRALHTKSYLHTFSANNSESPSMQQSSRTYLTGKVTEYSFHQSEKIEEAEIEEKDVKYLYNKSRRMVVYADPENPANRFKVAMLTSSAHKANS
jgi:hypothetical protein